MLLGCCLLVGALAQSASADPTPFATGNATCDSLNTTVEFPVVTAAHRDVVYELTSAGASGGDIVNFVSGDNGDSLSATFDPGDSVWSPTSAVDAGTALR